MLPFDDVSEDGNLPYLTEEIQFILDCTDRFRIKALIHFLASVGARPTAIIDPVLRIKHIKKIKDCIAVKIYDGSREGYWAFLTPESAQALNRYHKARKLNGEIFTDETPVFANENNTRLTKGESITTFTARDIMYRILKKSGISRTKTDNRLDKAAIYGF